MHDVSGTLLQLLENKTNLDPPVIDMFTRRVEFNDGYCRFTDIPKNTRGYLEGWSAIYFRTKEYYHVRRSRRD